MKMTGEDLKEARAALRANFSKWPRDCPVFRLPRRPELRLQSSLLTDPILHSTATVEYFEFTRREHHREGAVKFYDIFIGEQRVGQAWMIDAIERGDDPETCEQT